MVGEIYRMRIRNAITARLPLAAAAAFVVAGPACDRDGGEAPESRGGEPEAADEAVQAADPEAREGAPDPEAAEAAPAPEPEGPVGAIEGRVELEGEPPERVPLRRGSDPYCDQTEALSETVVTGDEGGLVDAFLRVEGEAEELVATPAPEEPVVVDQRECMYRPRVQGAVAGQTLRVENSDETLHNVRGRELAPGGEPGATLYNLAQPASAPAIEEPIEDGDVIELGCDMHAWMRAFVVISEHPYFATTGETGEFRIEGVPTGTYELASWHEHYGEKREEITVEEGETAEIELAYDAEADAPE